MRRPSPDETDLLTFFGLAFAGSWVCWGLSAAFAAASPLASAVFGIAASFGPSVAAGVVVAGRGGRAGVTAWLRRCLQWRISWRWFALAFLLPPAAMCAALAIHAALGGAVAASPAAGHLALAVVNFPLVFLLGGPLGEELGWRGYALPWLQERLGWRGAGVLLGLVWAAWHLPLFFTPGSAQAALPGWLFVPGTVALSVVFAWLSQATRGSVVPALVLHTAVNAWAAAIPVLGPHGGVRPYALLTAVMVAVAFALLAGGSATFIDRRAPPRYLVPVEAL